MKVGIVGWGVEGQSAYRYLGADNDYLIVSEEPISSPPVSERVIIQSISKERKPGLTGNVQDLSYMDGLDDCDMIVYTTPAAKNLETKFGNDKKFWAKTTTTQHLFFENVKTKNIIGITGSKGKGTTSTLIYQMLKAAGKTVFLGGNIGNSPLDFINDVQPDDWVVLELSNFQLYNLTYSSHIAVCLMITPEHLEWHQNMNDYVEAKANLFRHQTKNDIAIYYEDNNYSKRIAGYSPGNKVPYFYSPGSYVRSDGKIVVGPNETEIINKSELKLLGEHNLQNVCAAITAVWQVSQDTDAIEVVLSEFSGLEHRLEFVRELDSIKYFDDSFGTTPDTAIVALKAIIQPVVLILGGHDKGLEYTELIDEIAMKDKIHHVITIGELGPKLAEQLREKRFLKITEGLSTMPQIVAEARAKAQPGDAVLLSCGTSSFGLFKDYKDRGNQFKQVVRALS